MPIRLARGAGTVLEGDGAPFHDAMVRPAEPAEVAAWLERRAPRRARLAVGELALAPGVPLALDAGGFDRHTFMCGQSGSGKTYALGVMLEQLLLETGLRIVVLDPNSDYVRMREVRAEVEEPLAARYREAAAGIAVHRAGAAGTERLRLRLAELEPAAQAALLQLDPVADREEHAELDALLAAERPGTLEEFLASERPEARDLAMRVRNLGLDRLGVWARDDPGSTLDALQDGRGLVVDLGSLRTRAEQALMSAAVLGSLWRRREDRQPVLVVIDEAHNVCPAEPEDRLGGARDRLRGADRRRGPQVRPLPAGRHAAAAEGPSERGDAVRQPRPDAAQLARGRRLRPRRVLLRPAGPAGPRAGVRAGRGAGRRQDLPVGGPAPVRAPRDRGGRGGRAGGLGKPKEGLTPFR